MPCCGKFVHKRCHAKARQNSYQCGHCRVETHDSDDDTLSVDNTEALRADESLGESEDDDDPIWRMPAELQGPTRIEQAQNAIALLRASAMAHNLQHPRTLSWRCLPHHIDATTWYPFWVNLDWFISTNVGYPLPLYDHRNVYTPIPPVSRVRKTMYRHFNRLIPHDAHMCLSFVRYRLRFYHIAEMNQLFNFRYPYDPDEVNVTHPRMTRFWTPPIHPEDLFYTTLIPPPRASPTGQSRTPEIH